MAVRDIVQAAAGLGGAQATYVEDVFSTYLYTGTGTGQVISNGVALSNQNSGGSLFFDNRVNIAYLAYSNNDLFKPSSGDDWTIECFFWLEKTGVVQYIFDKGGTGAGGFNLIVGIGGQLVVQYNGDSVISYSAVPLTAGTWYHVALVHNSSTTKLYLNGTNVGSGNVGSITANADFTLSDDGSYQLFGRISNFRYVLGTQVYTTDFTPPTTDLTAISGTVLLVGTSSDPLTDLSTNAFTPTNSQVTEDILFGPLVSDGENYGGLVWLKNRDSATYWHNFFDTERGAGYRLSTNSTATSVYYDDTLTSFNADGFSLGSDVTPNNSGDKYASWTFRKTPKFFDMVTYTGNGTAGRTIAHNLGSVPGCIIVKRTDFGASWGVYHRSLSGTKYLTLNSTDAALTSASTWNSTDPTDSVFTVGDGSLVNTLGGTYIAYLFAHDAGGFGDSGEESIIKCGSLTADGSGNATVDLGWEPQWVLTKRTDSSTGGEWRLYDNMRGMFADPYSGAYVLKPNLSNADLDLTGYTDICKPLSNGFFGGANSYYAGGTYIYIAIRRGPMKTPTDATTVFTPVTRTATDPDYISGFPVDMGLRKIRNTSSDVYMYTRLLGENMLKTNATDVLSAASNDAAMDYNNGMTRSANGADTQRMSWMFRRSPGFFDVTSYTGTGSTQNISHNLGVAPEFIIVKGTDNGVGWWRVYAAPLGSGEVLYLNSTNAPSTDSTIWNNTTPTSSVFTVGTDTYTNGSGSKYVAYLFASCPGVSKVGSFTLSGSDVNVDCGFSNGARFVLIRRVSSTGGWAVFDTVRGIVSGNDPYIRLEVDNPETDSGVDSIDPYSAGFTAIQSGWGDGTYIYLAIA